MLKKSKNKLKKWFPKIVFAKRLSEKTKNKVQAVYSLYCADIQSDKFLKTEQTRMKLFSQFGEDGMLLYIFSVIGMNNKTFVDIGADDGINSNCANLAIHFGWHGLFLDSCRSSIKRGEAIYRKIIDKQALKPIFQKAQVIAENINWKIEDQGFTGEIGLLSIDIDGYDYHIWKAIEVVQPQVVITEVMVEFGDSDKVTPYHDFFNGEDGLKGASVKAFINLGHDLGYKLVGWNEPGINLIFVRNQFICNALPERSFEEMMGEESVRENYFEERN